MLVGRLLANRLPYRLRLPRLRDLRLYQVTNFLFRIRLRLIRHVHGCCTR